jgi:putative transposase
VGAGVLEIGVGPPVDLLDTALAPEAVAALRAAETIGRPLGSPAFLDALAARTGRDPRPRRRGPKPKAENGGSVKRHRNAQ